MNYLVRCESLFQIIHQNKHNVPIQNNDDEEKEDDYIKTLIDEPFDYDETIPHLVDSRFDDIYTSTSDCDTILIKYLIKSLNNI